jgi:hypothetical protein
VLASEISYPLAQCQVGRGPAVIAA